MTQETDTEYRGVLIFDGDCPFCSAAASALRRLDDVAAVEWDHEASQAFLEAQFGETPFALVLVDRAAETVWVGREAARELCDRAGVPTLVQDVVGDNYESLADAIRTVTGVDREPDAYHGEFPLAAPAAERFPDLSRHARKTHRPRPDRDRGARRDNPGDGREDRGDGRDDRGADPGSGLGRIADGISHASRRKRD